MLEKSAEQERIQSLVYFIANQEWRLGEEHFFESFVIKLAELAEVEFAFINRLVDQSTVETLALYADGKISANIRYDLKDTPCENVIGKQICSYRADVQKLFPNDSLLVDMNAASYSGIPLWDSNGEPLGLIAVISTKPLENIEFIETLIEMSAIRVASELHRLTWEQNLKESEEQFRGIFDNSGVGMTISKPDGRFITANEAFCKFIGYSKAELEELSIQDITHPDDIHLTYNVRKTRFENKLQFGEIEKRYITKSGETVWGRLNRTLIKKSDGAIRYTVGQVQDITKRKQTEKQLYQSQKMEAIGQLSSGIAHDFNNLLMAALGNIEVIEDQADNPELKDHAAVAKNAVLRGAELTKRLLAFSRQQTLEPELTEVGDLIKSLIVIFRRTLSEIINVNWEVPTDLWPVMIDHSQLESSLLNLVLNSRDAMLAGGTLTIGCKNAVITPVDQINKPELKAGEYVVIWVEDTGMGIQKDHLDKIIDPFFTTKGVGEGSGLGLSMVYGFVRQSGGFVDIESEPGIGTRVTLYLPREETVSSAVDVTAPPATKTPMGNGEKILVIEDEVDVRRITIKHLTKLGYQVLDGGDGRQLIDFCDNNSCTEYDLIVSDVVLSDTTSGPELIEMIQKCNQSAKALLITGYADPEMIRPGSDLPAHPILAKPFTYDELARKVFEILNSDDD